MTQPRNILALDTSTKSQALALVYDGEAVARRLTRVRTNHSESLLQNIDDMLVQAGWTVDDLDLVTTGIGPGTFTGLRVGVSTAKAIARSGDIPIIGVCSLAATARPVSALFEGTCFAVCDARRGEVYVASYRITAGDVEAVTEPHAATPDTVRGYVDGVDGPVVLIGNGLRKFPTLADWDRPDVRVLSQPWDGPSSVSIALLGNAAFVADGPDDLAALEPNYVRPSDAEMNFGPPDSTESRLT